MNKLKLPVMVALLASAAGSSAEINFRGFGSVVGGHAVSVDEGQSVLGYTDTISFKQDSLMALQMDADLDEGLSATMQLISRGKDEFDVNVEWAYLTYEVTDSVQVSAGRIRIPFYRYSDFLDVRYAFNWVTAPARVYSFDFPGMDGLSLLWNTALGPVDSSFQVMAGSLDGYTGDTPIKFDNFVGAVWIGSWEWLTGRASYNQSTVSLPLSDAENIANSYTALGQGMQDVAQGFGGVAQGFAGTGVGSRAGVYAAGFNTVGQALVANADNVRVYEDDGIYTSLGIGVDKGSFLLDAEWIYYELDDSLIPDTSAYYLTLGWRVGPTVIYGTYSREESDPNTAFTSPVPDLSLVANAIQNDAELAQTLQAVPSLPDDLGATAIGLVANTEGIRAAMNSQRTDIVNTHIGMRWDFHPSAAFKVAYEITDNRVTDTQGGVFRTAIDFVF